MITDKQERKLIREVAALLESLKRDIADDYRIDGQDDDTPTMQVTIATNDGDSWVYQTGDTGFVGSCYGHQHWGIGYLTRRSNSRAVATEMVGEILESLAMSESCEA